jgi:hypothetical protein
MRIPKRLLTTVTTLILCATASFGAAIVPGFNTTSDGRNDDGTYTTGGCNIDAPGGFCSGTPVPIGFNINFFGVNSDSLYINTNGNVTFDAPLSTFTPFSLDDALRQIIAPFFADVDTRNPSGGVVTFGNGTFDGRNAFGVNWINVGYFDQHVDKTNSFQLLLVDRSNTGAGNFDIIFNFDRILWETSDASFGNNGLGGLSARAGFSNGTGAPGDSLELLGSGIPGSFLDDGPNALNTHSLNSDVAGRYIFNAREGNVTVVPEPGTFALLAVGSVLVLLRRRARS